MRSGADFGLMVIVLLVSIAGCTAPNTGSSMALKEASDPVLSPSARLRQVADGVIADHGEIMPFDWGEGVLMAGMMRAGEELHQPHFITFVKQWADHWQQSGLDQVLAGRGSEMKGYCGHWGPGLALLLLYEQTKDPVYLKMADEIAAFIEKKATRTSEGGLAHWRGNQQLWADTLYMVCPLQARLSRIESRPGLKDDAALQLDVYTKHSRDERVGLFYHIYDERLKQNVGQLWGRGNGWTAMAYVEVLKVLDRHSPAYDKLHAGFMRQVEGILATQDRPSGLWHTVMDRPESYLETSASAMLVYALAEAYRLGLIERRDDVERAVVDGWSALATKVDEHGRVVDVSAGTGPSRYEVYAQKPRGTYTWGTGAFLLAASELSR